METAHAESQHYASRSKEYKKLLSNSGIKKEFTHDNLERMGHSVTAASTQVEGMRRRLAEFKALPPSIPLANQRIHEVKEQIRKIETEFPEMALSS